MPNTKKTYHYQEQRSRIPPEQLQFIDKSLARIREWAWRIAIEQQGNLQNTTTAAGDPRDPNIGSGNPAESTGTSVSTGTETVDQPDPTTSASGLKATGTATDGIQRNRRTGC
jgi:hypothetical protein